MVPEIRLMMEVERRLENQRQGRKPVEDQWNTLSLLMKFWEKITTNKNSSVKIEPAFLCAAEQNCSGQISG